MTSLPRLEISRLNGSEPFTTNEASAGFSILDFWQWSTSDLVSNVLRGVLAEYIVAQALGIAEAVRDPWLPYDLKTPAGLTLEVKSCAYLQSWFQKGLSDIWFSIGETTEWSADTNQFVGPKKRQAHAYVFALLKHIDKATLNPRDLDQWEFYIVPTSTIAERCGSRQQLSLKALVALNPIRTDYGGLRVAIDDVESRVLLPPS